MRSKQTAGRKKAAGVEVVVRIGFVLVASLIAWATLPSMAPEKVNVNDLRGAAKYQARKGSNDALSR